MKFTALTVDGKVAKGTGVAESNENWRNWTDEGIEGYSRLFGESLSYMFNDAIEWCDGREFNVSDFVIVWTSTIKIDID